MKRRPVLFPLALVIIALFADDVESIVRFPQVGVQSTVAIHTQSPAPITGVRLVDGVGAYMELARVGRSLRDSVATSFAELPSSHMVACASFGAGIGRTHPLTSSLVSQHMRLQV